MHESQPSKVGKVVIVSGPSGVGKSTICREVVKRLNDVSISLSATTRAQAVGEVNGQDYLFLTREEFGKRLVAGDFVEHAEVFGNYYGTPKENIDKALARGESLILEIDVQGARQAKRVYPDAAMVFILPPSSEVLTERLSGRGRDSAESTEQRLGEADKEIAAAWQYYEHRVINENLETAIEEVIQIVRGEASTDKA